MNSKDLLCTRKRVNSLNQVEGKVGCPQNS